MSVLSNPTLSMIMSTYSEKVRVPPFSNIGYGLARAIGTKRKDSSKFMSEAQNNSRPNRP